MFVKPPSRPAQSVYTTHPTVSPSPSTSTDPLGGVDPLLGNTLTPSPLIRSPGLPPPSNGNLLQNDLDPLSGSIKPTYMSQSVRIQPTRPRVDAKEAASKLANMF
jgi:hypothetical protein